MYEIQKSGSSRIKGKSAVLSAVCAFLVIAVSAGLFFVVRSLKVEKVESEAHSQADAVQSEVLGVEDIEAEMGAQLEEASLKPENDLERSSREDDKDDKKDKFLNFIVREIFIVGGRNNISISAPQVEQFLKRCDFEGSSKPCVDVGRVRQYVKEIKGLLKKDRKKEFISNNLGNYWYYIDDADVDYESLVQDIVSILSYRINVVETETNAAAVANLDEIAIPKGVRIKYKEVPGTDGNYSDKYIEVDHSQQHLYVWERGELVYDWEVSGVIDSYAVLGVFQIGEKSPEAWSDIAEKWMPYWMSYYFDPIQEAWFGIHGLVWWEDNLGVHYESEASIGNKKSGGCIRLNVENAEKLYNWTEPGTYVLIHE
jgi:lipoprotein-anchoring transpeptidase ErfK/SrfK